MLKRNLCSCIIAFITIILISSVCFATDSNDAVTLSEGSDVIIDGGNTEDGAVETTVVSEGDEIITTGTDENYINSDYFKAETNILIDEDVIIDGNAYIIGEEVTIKGKIVGDLFVVAKNLTIQGSYVYNNLYACATNITIKGEGVVYNLYGVCDNLLIDTESVVYRDLLASANSITIKGAIGRDTKLSTNSLSIVPSETGANIYGNLTYSASQEIEVPENAVKGDVKFNNETSTVTAPKAADTIKDHIFSLIKVLIITSLIFLFVILLMPKFTKKASDLLTTKTGLVVLVGFIILVAVPLAVVVLLITVLGLPLAFALSFVYWILIRFSHALLSIVIANIIIGKIKTDKKIFLYLFALATSAVIFLLQLIPFIGGIITLAVVIVNLGICTKLMWPNKKEKLVEPVE